MKWAVLNALGGLSWIAGLEYAKGTSFTIGLVAADEHRLVAGFIMGLCGLSILLWTNIRNPV